MKKYIAPLAVITIIALIIFLAMGRFSSHQEQDIDSFMDRDELESMEGENRPEREAPPNEVIAPEVQNERDERAQRSRTHENEEEVHFPRFDQLNEDELDELEVFYDEAEEGWANRLENLILNEFNLGPDQMEAYQRVRDDFEEARWTAFEEFHERMFMEEGSDFSYHITEYYEEVERPLAERHRERVRELLGDEKYKRFLEVKDEYNDHLRSLQDPSKGLILIHL